MFRGIAGFGASGMIHTSALTNLSFNLNTLISPGHIVSWLAEDSGNG